MPKNFGRPLDRPLARSVLLALLISGSPFACSSSNGGGGTGTGGSGGGSSGTGGGNGGTTVASGGTTGSGGTVSGNSGGTTGSGGSASGGTTGSGGAGSGGASGSGGSVADTGADISGGDGRDTASPGDTVSPGDTSASPMAIARIMPLPGGTITGTVTFVAKGADVEVVYALENCPPGNHPTHIHEGSSCASTATQGMHWDVPRGDGIGSGAGQITCDAQMKGAFAMPYIRSGAAANTRWTIGTAGNTDIVGHVLMVHGVNDTNLRHGCGVITKQ